MSYTHVLAGRRQFLAWGSSSLLLAGCSGSLIGPSQAPLKIYVLNPPFKPSTDALPVKTQLLVSQPEAAHSFQNARIGLERGSTFDYYADAQWTDSTPHLIQTLLVDAFESSGKINGVAPESAGMHADYILETDIRDFEAKYGGGEAPPTVAIVLGVRLISARGDVVGSVVAQQTAMAGQNSVPSVVEAFSQATGRLLSDIVAWTLTTLHGDERASRAHAAQ